MWDLVGNPEDRFSRDAVHMQGANRDNFDHQTKEEIRCVSDDI